MPRLRVRPGKANAVFGVVTGAIMLGIGIFVVIPTFGTFGVFWTLFAAAIAGYNAFMAFSGGGSERDVYLDDMDQGTRITSRPLYSPQNNETASRLRELESLRAQNLISDEEYQEKRGEIIQDL